MFDVFPFQMDTRVAYVSINLLLLNLGTSGVASPGSMLVLSLQYSPIPRWSFLFI